MTKLTPEGEQIVAGLAEQYKIGADAVKAMLDAVARGGGTVAQFNVPEFGGAGEWMRGAGMTTIAGMANAPMKATVDNLCNELSNLMTAQASLFAPIGQPPSHGEGAGTAGQAGAGASSKSYNWWPAELGEPSIAGSRNACRYAYFAEIRRLAVDWAGRMEVYDTTGFVVEGLAVQQAGKDAQPIFASNRGPVRLDILPRVYGIADRGRTAPEPGEVGARSTGPVAAATQKAAAGDAGSILALIEQLGALKEKGILTEEEFAAKKAELLNRL